MRAALVVLLAVAGLSASAESMTRAQVQAVCEAGGGCAMITKHALAELQREAARCGKML